MNRNRFGSFGRSTGSLRVVVLLLATLVAVAACSRSPLVGRQNYIERGNRYLNDKRYSEAAIEYRNALQVDPRFGEAYFRLGLCLLQEAQWASAADSLARAVEYSPENLEARLRLGDILVAAGQFSDAHNQAEEVLKRDPRNASAHMLLGQIQIQQKKYAEAEDEFTEALGLAPQDAIPYGNLALAQLLNREFDAAEKNFQKARDLKPDDPQFAINLSNFFRSRQQSDRAEQVLREAIAQNPNAVSLPLAIADLYVYQAQDTQAKRVLDQIEADGQHYADGHRWVADFYFKHNDASSALDRYLPLAKKDSSDQALIESVIECYLQMGRWPDALQWIDHQEKVGKKQNNTLQLFRARAYLGEYHLREAIAALQVLIQKEPSNAAAHFYLAQADLQRGDRQAAKGALIDALRVQPGYVPALLGLGDISLQQSDPAIASEYAKQLITQSYWLVEAHLIAGNAYVLRNDLAAALKEFQVAAALNPRNPAAQERVGRVLAAQGGKYKEAEKAYEDALNDDPTYAPALTGLVDNFLKQGQTDLARARIQQQIERQPAAHQLQIVRGQFCLDRGDWACAEQSFRKALELNPYDVTTYLSLARVYTATNQKDQVVLQYEQARQKFPDFLPTYIELGLAYEERGDFERAKQAYQDALRIDTDFAPARNNLAWLYSEHGGPLNEALELAQQAKKQQPDDTHIDDTLAWIYYKLGLYPSAISLLELAVKKDPKDFTFQFHLGMAYLAQGKQQLGRKSLQTALRLGLEGSDARAAREALQKAGS